MQNKIPVSSIIESQYNQRLKWYDTSFESFDLEGLHGFLRTWNRIWTPGSAQPHVIMPSLPNEGDNQGTSCLTLSSELPYQSTIKRKVRKKKKNGIITANVAGTKYEIVRLVIDEMGFVKTRDEDETANLIWSDSAVQQDKIAELRNYQRINHFPGMGEICRKDFLARNMTKMIKSQPQDYSFIPRTWIFPAEYMQFQNYVKELKKKRRQKTFIVKPANGAMGHGISLIRNGEKLQAQDHLIVQEYLDKPFLMEGYKFDLRVYILVTSCDPLKIFLYHDGLVRMGTEKYHPPNDSNLSQLYMHLTNYSVNKHNEHFERDETEDKGSKRSIKWFTEFLQTNHLDVSKFWSDISELVVKTLIVAEPHVLHAYRMCRPGQAPGSDSVCFEVLGFDILLDRKLKPWLLEINRAPSFGTDQKIDYDVKKGVLLNALKLLNIRTSDKRRNLAQQKAEAQKRLYGQGSMKRLSPGSSDWEKQRHTLERRREELKERLAQVRKQISKEEHENRHMGNYRRIYPPDDKLLLEKYESLLAIAFQTFLAGRAASLQRELNNPLKRMKEEDILDLLEQCELDDEKLMGKSTRQPGPKIMDNWKYHKTNVASYWLIKLDSVKQRKVLDIVRTSVRAVLQRVWRVSDAECLHLYRIFNRLFNRLLWSHGQGLWNCFCNSGSSWETIFSKRTEVVTPEQLQCCQRLVQLCKHCLLVAYKYSADSRGSVTGISPDWDDTRYLLPGPSQLIMKTSSNFICTSSGMPRSNILFAPRYSHL
ncbi:tubulin polyglutamylase TTLL7 isoform X5 [Lepidochelys kempii]|uniref:tubulin polyglutamylase TTLL7 isoform X5 n=1 Tax=Lepidochelys kempii TaxID=8472 RepID=UPI003C6FE3CD